MTPGMPLAIPPWHHCCGRALTLSSVYAPGQCDSSRGAPHGGTASSARRTPDMSPGCSLKRTHKIALEMVEHTGKGLPVVKHRWQVERTLAWLLHDRCHRRDDERLTVSSEAMVPMSMIRLFVTR